MYGFDLKACECGKFDSPEQQINYFGHLYEFIPSLQYRTLFADRCSELYTGTEPLSSIDVHMVSINVRERRYIFCYVKLLNMFLCPYVPTVGIRVACSYYH